MWKCQPALLTGARSRWLLSVPGWLLESAAGIHRPATAYMHSPAMKWGVRGFATRPGGATFRRPVVPFMNFVLSSEELGWNSVTHCVGASAPFMLRY